MLNFVGLGLYDERSVTLQGRDKIAEADRVVAEFYTSRLPGTDLETLEMTHDRSIDLLDRADVEQTPEVFLDEAERSAVAFLTGGDPLISTTHVDLRLRAAARGIETNVVHGPSASTAASSLTGLQNYRFGKATTIPFPVGRWPDGVPPSVVETIEANADRGLHTLAYLDLDGADGPCLSANVAAQHLAAALDDRLGVVVARAGSDHPVVDADRLSELARRDYGPPLHLLIVPGELHEIEATALETFANAPPGLLP